MVQAVIPTTVVALQGHPVAATAPTTGQALAWNGSAYAPAGPYLTAAGAPYIVQNYVDNSGFLINQRSLASGTALAAGAYGFDRWKAGASGCTLTWTYSPASTIVTIAAGTIQQVIDGTNLINATYTLSWTGSATGRVNTGTYVASPITFTGAPNTNVTIEFQGGTLGQVQLQIGSQATLWQPPPNALEWVRCQRFFQLTGAGWNVEGGWLTVNGASNLQTHTFPVQFRASPSVTITNPNFSGNTIASVAVSVITPATFNVIVTPAAGVQTQIYYCSYGYTASADL